MIGGFRGDHPEVVKALGAAEPAIRPRLGARAAPSRRRQAPGRKARPRRRSSGWETILVDHPTDALALRLAQDAYYFLGRSLAIRDCAARVLPAWDRDNPLTSFILGLYAFGLEETGDLKRAEDVGREALAGATRATPGRRMRSPMSWRPRTARTRASPFSSRRARTGVPRISWPATTAGIWRSS